MNKCTFCNGELEELKIKHPIITHDGERKIIEIDVMFCQNDKHFYVNDETLNYIRSLRKGE